MSTRAPRFFALGLGDDANVDLLRAVMGESVNHRAVTALG